MTPSVTNQLCKTEFDSPLSTVTIGEIDQDISKLQAALSSFPQSNGQCAAWLSTLANLRLHRFHRLDNELDLETSILQFTHAIFLPLSLSTDDNTNIISTLFSLNRALCFRLYQHEQANDVKFCIKCLHFLRDTPCKAFGVTRNEVTTSLVDALALQMKLEPVNAMQNVEEMSALFLELLSSDLPNAGLENAISNFSRAVMDPLSALWIRPSQQVIECLREANMRLPGLHLVSFALFRSFVLRFYVAPSMDDYENAMAVLEKIHSHHSLTDPPSPYLREALFIAVQAAWGRSNFYGKPEDIEEAIIRCHGYLGSSSPGDPHRDEVIQFLVELERTRFNTFGVTSGLLEAHSSDPEVVDLPSFPHLVASLVGSNAVKSCSMSLEDRVRHLQAVEAMDRITNKADIEEAVKYGRLLLTSLQQDPGDATQATHLTVDMLGNFFHRAFRLTDNREYLDESIDIYRGLINTPRAKLIRFRVIRRLILSLCSLFLLSDDEKDLNEIMRLSHIAATDAYATAPSRFEASCQWAWIARGFKHFSTSIAYKTAISLMQDSLAFAPTLETQHSRLVAMREDIETLPLDYASYQISIGQLKDAIEILERGRGFLWSEMRGLRTSIDQLRTVGPGLAEKFATVNKGLEELTASGSPDMWSNDGDVDAGEGMDPFGRTLMTQRKLLDERTSLITQIRSLPSFENFLTAPSFDALRSAAAHGPVIIINHCEWRSDIIILLYDSSPSYIPTPDNFYDHATSLKDQLLAAREKGLDSKEYEVELTSVLETLYNLVGQPVIQRLQELNVPEQSCIWWCPTSVFCSLPLHAMGPVRSDGHFKLYFSDLYIPSYTPTLSALIESRKSGSHSFEKPSMLLVAQPDESMPAAWREISLVRCIEATVTTLCAKKATPSAVMKHLQTHRFAHFSCHGILETGKPCDASFKLYRDRRLTLLEIIRSRLPSAEFAFLSACHTAELTDESIANEGLHLCAAVQYSGFRSVVGTTWAMADEDGPVVTKSFYGSVFSDTWKGVPYYERTARALRDAVKELRMKGVATERWVNFVHYGA